MVRLCYKRYRSEPDQIDRMSHREALGPAVCVWTCQGRQPMNQLNTNWKHMIRTRQLAGCFVVMTVIALGLGGEPSSLCE